MQISYGICNKFMACFQSGFIQLIWSLILFPYEKNLIYN